MSTAMNRPTHGRQAGAALATSLLILSVLTLLGLAAMRGSKTELRLSQNAESRVNALQSAQAIADGVTQNDGNLTIGTGPGYSACYVPSSSGSGPDSLPFTCSSPSLAAPDDTALQSWTYARVVREDPEFLSAAALRGAGNSGRSYDYARFTIIGGYDHSAQGFGASEVVQGVLKLHAKPTGVSYQ